MEDGDLEYVGEWQSSDVRNGTQSKAVQVRKGAVDKEDLFQTSYSGHIDPFSI